MWGGVVLEPLGMEGLLLFGWRKEEGWEQGKGGGGGTGEGCMGADNNLLHASDSSYKPSRAWWGRGEKLDFLRVGGGGQVWWYWFIEES